ncbi:MAG: HAD family hydrolase [Spirochaetaceae bacterium]|jgi:putative hydrolase of the HAD superfamily|nr:HAD family hydrolase [Spirochaetaceae bacterium]
MKGNLPGLKAVAFDLDGTLYPNYRLYCRVLLSVLAHPRFFYAFTRVRHRLHRREGPPSGDRPVPLVSGASFCDIQAAMMGTILGQDPRQVKEQVERLIYRRWEERFSRIRLFPYVRETLSLFRGAGLKLGLLSDFPPARKVSLLRLDGFFDILLSTEDTGALKPSPLPFAALIEALSCRPEEILYVGNSPRFDIAGAGAAGMKTALIRRSILSTGCRPACSRGPGGHQARADFVFRDYRQLRKYVLG